MFDKSDYCFFDFTISFGGKQYYLGITDKYFSKDRFTFKNFTLIGKRRAKSVRTRSAYRKVSVLAADTANLFDPKTKKYGQAKIKTVVENPANRHFIRRNIMTKGTVIDTNKGKARITSRPWQDGAINAVLIS